MSLSPGTRLGSYEIVSPLGAGGMGEVYRAKDTKLGRDVAIKALPEAFALDADRLARFEREAKTLASINHPNIAAIYGIENNALVMELVDGEDLSAIIARGPMALDDVRPIARQIADALEAAHEQGIIHRDLKPANIKVRADGTVKVLDFGLAKAMDPAGASGANASNSPTLTARATQMGMIIGTAAYMAPEQARGRAVDRRADIWAFGVVLYEMLTGRRAFEGDDISITLASVLKDDVSFAALPTELPTPIRRLLRRCLEKDPKRRLGAISDARLELEESASPLDSAPVAVARAGIGRLERAIWASVAVLAVIAVIVVVFVTPRSASAPDGPPARFGVLPPSGGRFTGLVPRFAISPDGRALVFAATLETGKPEQLWLRRLDSTEVRPIPGTAGAIGALSPQSPFWSPDGRYVAYFVETDLDTSIRGQSRLLTLDLQGGSVQKVCDVPLNNGGGSWNAEGVILVSSQATKGIQRVPATGGVPVQVTTLDPSRNEVAHLFPQFLPDGRHFIYQVRSAERSGWTTFVGSIDSSDRKELVQSDYARFAGPNMLLYLKDDNLLAQIMDPRALALVGEPVLVGAGINSMPSNRRAGFSVSNTGVLVMNSSSDAVKTVALDRQLTWVDRSGKPVGTIATPTSAARLRLSPDGTRVVLIEATPRSFNLTMGSLWVADLGRDARAPLTAGQALALSPTWSADSARVLFGSGHENGNATMMERAASGATQASTVVEAGGRTILPLDESADGARVVFTSAQAGVRSLHILTRSDGKSAPYLTSEFDYPQASLSRDGKWLAYVSNESGDYQVVVQPFPDPSLGKWPISTGGGFSPRWRQDGRELFYVDYEGRLVAVSISADRAFAPGRATVLFALPSAPRRSALGAPYVYDVAADGQRFLVSLPSSDSSQDSPLTVTTNWTALMKK